MILFTSLALILNVSIFSLSSNLPLLLSTELLVVLWSWYTFLCPYLKSSSYLCQKYFFSAWWEHTRFFKILTIRPHKVFDLAWRNWLQLNMECAIFWDIMLLVLLKINIKRTKEIIELVGNISLLISLGSGKLDISKWFQNHN